MSLNPLNELKRRLEDDNTPLPKRLCLAKNIVQSHNFPTAPKQRIVSEWLEQLSQENKLDSLELKKVLDWLNGIDDLTSELRSKFIQIVSNYIQSDTFKTTDIQFIISFLENAKITSQLGHQIDDFISITINLLKHLKDNEDVILSNQIFTNIIKYHKESKKKFEFITKLLNGDNLKTIFSYLDSHCRPTVIEVCQNILFPIIKKKYFISYLQTLIRKDNLEELIAEKGDNIQSVLKIMSIFFDAPTKDPKFLRDFIDVFVTSFKSESQIIFAFYIMVANVLNMKQNYIIPSMNMTPIIFESNPEKTKRHMFLNMLEIILQNEIDISVRLTDTFGEKVSKVEIKKNFLSLLQNLMMDQLKLDGKTDKNTILIIKTALQLDPSLIEQKMDIIIPKIMTLKKSSNLIQYYREMLICLLEILFKLSRGTLYFDQILPSLKVNLENDNTDQIQIRNSIKQCAQEGNDFDKLKSCLLTGNDVFPQICLDVYGKLTTDLMFRQNKELLESLKKNFEDYCLVDLEEVAISPSTITLTEVLSAILSTVIHYSKMADHTVPVHIAQEFWELFKKIEEDCLKKFGECVLKSDEPSLLLSFLKLCLSYSQLKLLNIKYSHFKLDVSLTDDSSTVYDMSMLLPCLRSEQWTAIAEKVVDSETMEVLDNLILIKVMTFEVLSVQNSTSEQSLIDAKSYLIKQLTNNQHILETNNYFQKVLFHNLNKNQNKQLAKVIVNLYLNDELHEINNVAITNNRFLLNSLVLEVAKNITNCFENCDSLSKALNKTDFNFAAFAKEINMKQYFTDLNLKENQEDRIKKCIELLQTLQLPYLKENYQITAIFILLTIKKSCQSKKIRKNIDNILQNIYELSQLPPDLYQVFPVEFLFSFEDKTLIDLLTLKNKASNHHLVLKCLLESAVKRSRTGNDTVVKIVELLATRKNTTKSIEAFSDTAFQITCIILPLIVKHKKVLTSSAHRSILADLQERLHSMLLNTFKNIDFGNTFSPELELAVLLNAIPAYTLTLSRYCETTDVEAIKKLDCLWSGLEFFVDLAIEAIRNPDTKPQYIESSIQLINIILRHIKKLDTHPIFADKDKLLIRIWTSVNERLLKVFDKEGSWRKSGFMNELAVTLKFVCELSSVECFVSHFVAFLSNLVELKTPTLIIKDETTHITRHSVSKYLWIQCLKANTAGPKCGAMTKLIYQSSRNLKLWVRQHYDTNVTYRRKRKVDIYEINNTVKINDVIGELIKIDLDTLAEVILAGKKITLDYKFLDVIFELQHMVLYIMGATPQKCEISWQSYFSLFDGCVAMLNSLLVSRAELLEDRWPCFMQCYQLLVSSLSQKSSSDILERYHEEKLAEIAHNIEKLTQSITKRKKEVSRISAYTVADICTFLERDAPSKMVRQHLENSVALLIQASDSSYAMAFLKRALAGSVGQMTMSNLYTMYKRYHKYVGNA